MLHVKDDDRAMGMSMTLGGPQCHLQIQFEKTEEEFVHNVPYCIITSQLCTGTNCNLKSAQSKPKMVVSNCDGLVKSNSFLKHKTTFIVELTKYVLYFLKFIYHQ